MDEKIEKMLVRILYLALISISALMLMRNLSNPWGLLLLIGFYGMIFTLRKAVLDSDKNRLSLSVLCIALEIASVFFMGSLDRSGSSHWLYFLIIADVAFFMPTWIIALCAVPAFAFQSLGLYIHNPGRQLFEHIGILTTNAIVILMLLTILGIVRYQVGQRQKLTNTMLELKVKSRQLNNAYMKLKDNSEELEEMTIVMERNRIAREIHDTVGHTLTTVLLELEAAERLIPVDPALASEKLSIAKGQVRKGLSDIRESVHTLKAGHEIIGLEQSLMLLLEETQKSGVIHIKSSIGEIPELTKEQEKMIYRALQEGLTNGIRHGNSTAFVFRLFSEGGYLRFFLSDNGKGSASLDKGFGLSSMEERIKALGGTLQINTGTDEGFTILISIPVEHKVAEGEASSQGG